MRSQWGGRRCPATRRQSRWSGYGPESLRPGQGHARAALPAARTSAIVRVMSQEQSTAEVTRTFREARDFLIAHREDYETAYRDFERPAFDRFNWARDW